MQINRDLMKRLVDWKDSPNRKPLILKGVRQCGKTWLLKEFGQLHFDSVAYFNFMEDDRLASVFKGSYEPKRLLLELGALARAEITPKSTLLIFDEIQTCPRALNALKFFCENAPEYAIASAGSLLGISLSSPEGFPVGKVDFLELDPCSFREYLETVEPSLAELCDGFPLEPIPEALAQTLAARLKEYLAFGGMPAVLSTFIDTRDTVQTDAALDSVIQAYTSDFSKHVPRTVTGKLELIWRSIPVQMARENRRFFYSEVREGARARELEDALTWLQDSWLVRKVDLVPTPKLPLLAYAERKIFKLYCSDVGVLRRLAKLDASVILAGSDAFVEFKGRIAENYVLQQLHALGIDPVCYWANPRGNAEVDFLMQDRDIVIPVEVKSGLNLAAKSLKVYRELYAPALAVRTSLQNLRLDNGLLNIPLYLLFELPRLLRAARDRASK